MPAPRLRAAAALALAALVAACASADSGAEETAKDPAAKPAMTDRERTGFYAQVHSLTENWIQSYTGGSEAEAAQSRALETAIAREVWTRFDEVLKDLLEADNPRWRLSAARGLGFVNDPRARPALEDALRDPDPGVVAAALVSLGRIASPHTEDPVVARLLGYPDKVIQGNAAVCLARVFTARRQGGMSILKEPEREGQIEAALFVLLFDKDDAIVRGNAAQALGALGSKLAEDSLVNRLRDESIFVRIKIAQSLSSVGSPRSYGPLLEALAREKEKNVQLVTALALGAVAERQGKVPPYAELKADASAWRKWLGE
jgi:HEAT repeat protein